MRWAQPSGVNKVHPRPAPPAAPSPSPEDGAQPASLQLPAPEERAPGALQADLVHPLLPGGGREEHEGHKS